MNPVMNTMNSVLVNNSLFTFIAYARVSTASSAESLQAQAKDIEKVMTTDRNLHYTMVLPEIRSVGDGITDNLRTTISSCYKNKKKNKKVVLIVTSFDRITRNSADLPYLIKHVHCVIEIRSGRVIVPEEYEVMINESQAELTNMIRRAIRTHASEHAGRQIEQLQQLAPSLEEKIRRAKVRLVKAHAAIMSNPVNTMTEQDHDQLVEFIRRSQELVFKTDWLELSVLSLRLSNGKVSAMDQYPSSVDINKNVAENEETVVKLSKQDVCEMLYQFPMFDNISESLMKEYILAIFNLTLLTANE